MSVCVHGVFSDIDPACVYGVHVDTMLRIRLRAGTSQHVEGRLSRIRMRMVGTGRKKTKKTKTTQKP